MLKQILIIIAMSFSGIVISQSTSIKGILFNTASLAIENSTVELYYHQSEKDIEFIGGTITKEDGSFLFENIEPGKYRLDFKHINYEPYSQVVVVKNQVFDLGTVVLFDKLNTLDEIIISGKRLPITQTADKIVVNISQNILGVGGTPIEVLKQLPTVTISSEGAVSIRGKGDVQILIDGKPSGFAALQGQRFLDQLDLSTIETIEVITNPSVIKSSTGAGGVINIIMKKNKKSGFSGKINAGVGSDEWYHISPNLNYKVNNANLFFNYTLRSRKRLSENTSFKKQNLNNEIQTIEESQKGVRDDLRNNVQLGLDYYINDTTYFTLAGNYRNRDKQDEQNRFTTIQNSDEIQELRTGIIREPEENEGWGTVAQFTSSVSEKKELTVLLDYVHSVEKEDIFREEIIESEQPNFIDGDRSFYVDINDRLLLDFENKLTRNDSTKIIYGAQTIYRKINQTFNALEFNNENGIYENIPALNNEFDYYDFIAAAYLQFEMDVNRWSYQAAIRLEAWHNKYNSINIDGDFQQGYFKVFPSFKIGYDFSNRTNAILSFKKGLNRPSPNRLNPFPGISNAFNISIGNPDLNPELFYTMELGLKTKINKVTVTQGLFFTIYNDLIQQITELRDDGITIRMPININNMYHYGVDLNTQFNLSKWWSQQIGGLFYKRSFNDPSIINNDQFSYQFKNTSIVDFSESLKFQFFGSYTAPENNPQGEVKSMFYIDAGLEYEFLKKKAGLTLTATDIFDTLQEETLLNSNSLEQNLFQKINTRRVYLTLDFKL